MKGGKKKEKKKISDPKEGTIGMAKHQHTHNYSMEVRKEKQTNKQNKTKQKNNTKQYITQSLY